ncbi:hypothetical protein THAOC_10586 [Thalassiosira oceanica]|uniref:Uncharacterized protein n=1 Tax=Thalassiosira oceanica TaxID=159749 RepID=K0SS98_THAOC|nr:hypothetical protein THAOC_10586 [Thalassiosira oceanica]|eukprot:EJK68255.1 hypothetical protein THAOC_10586 [Thalassiosira oceanica]
MALLTTPNHCDIQRRRRVGGFAAEITPTGRRDTQANWELRSLHRPTALGAPLRPPRDVGASAWPAEASPLHKVPQLAWTGKGGNGKTPPWSNNRDHDER